MVSRCMGVISCSSTNSSARSGESTKKDHTCSTVKVRTCRQLCHKLMHPHDRESPMSQFGRGRLSLVAISFYALSLLFGPCRLSEFTLAGPHIYCSCIYMVIANLQFSSIQFIHISQALKILTLSLCTVLSKFIES